MSSDYGWMILFLDKDDICGHNEQSVTDGGQGVVLHDLIMEKQVMKS
jgi:hypothetical protein